ncbi:unnamed protein product [Urochloa decumbens]|uniref:Replication factor-A protein 1 N-terminal domain-containing protein n=1 Tax=Urochloa decumbens TaxID=240449 RepID=A0ABC9C0V2_9POAL
MEAELSRGAVAAIWEHGAVAEMPLVLQVLDVSPWPASPGWYATVLSDGLHLIIAALRLFKTAAEAEAAGPDPLRRRDVVRLFEYESKALEDNLRFIYSRQLEVLQTDCVKIGDPKHYPSGYFEDKNEELDAQLMTSSCKLNNGDYSAEQGSEKRLARGLVAMLQHPEMQVVGVSPMRSELKNFERYYLILSDGVHTQNATLEPHLNHLVKDTRLRRGTIVQLLNFVCYNVQNPSIIIVYDLKVLPIECELIGSPKSYELCCIKKAYGLGNNSGSAANSAQPNDGPYFSCQGSKWYLTQGAVAAIMKGEMAVEQQPVMQVVGFSLVSHNGLTFYRVLLSDGVHQVYTNLFPHLSHLVEDNCLRKGTRVRLLKFMCDTFDKDQDGRIAIAVELEVLETECELIGSPTFYDLGSKQRHPNLKPFVTTPCPRGSQLPASGSFYSLTWGVVSAIWKDAAAGTQPVLQVFDLLPYTEMEMPLLSPILLSDGAHLIRGGLPADIISSKVFRAGHLHRGTVVRLREFMCHNDRSERVIVVLDLEVLQTNCVIVGNPKWYPFGNLEDKREELDAESVSGSCKLNCGAYSAGQGLKEFLITRGMVGVLQQPVMQVVDVIMMRSELKKFEMYHLILSDSVNTQDATLAAHLNHLVKNKLLRKGTIIRLLEFMCNTSQSPSVIIVIQIEVLQTDCGLIGSPKAYEPSLFEKPYVPEGKYGEPYPRSVAKYAELMNGPFSSSQGFKRHLTGGAVSAVLRGEMEMVQQPVMQVVGISIYKPYYRISLSDGVHWMNSVLLSNHRYLVDDNLICEGTIVRLKFSSDTFQNYRIFHLVRIEVLQKNCELIGSPTFLEYANFPGDRTAKIDWMPAIIGHRRGRSRVASNKTQIIWSSVT